ncbi:VOC family protein [Sulfitobacter sp. LCG007]
MRLSAVTLLVPDYDTGIAFYVGKLGFMLKEDVAQDGKRWVRLQPEGGGTSFILAEPRGARQTAALGEQGGGRVWLFLETGNFQRDHTRLMAAGVTFEETPRTEPYGKVAVFRDPFGNRWDLIEYASSPDPA